MKTSDLEPAGCRSLASDLKSALDQAKAPIQPTFAPIQQFHDYKQHARTQQRYLGKKTVAYTVCARVQFKHVATVLPAQKLSKRLIFPDR